MLQHSEWKVLLLCVGDCIFMDTMGSRKNKDSTFLHANSRKNLKGKRKKNVLNPTKGGAKNTSASYRAKSLEESLARAEARHLGCGIPVSTAKHGVNGVCFGGCFVSLPLHLLVAMQGER